LPLEESSFQYLESIISRRMCERAAMAVGRGGKSDEAPA